MQTHSVNDIFNRIREHTFPDNRSGYKGIADVTEDSWMVRILTIRDLVRLGEESIPDLQSELICGNPNVRFISLFVLGLFGAEQANLDIIDIVENDPDDVVRCQAAQALGQIGLSESIPVLEKLIENDPNKDLNHRAELAVKRINERHTAEKNKELIAEIKSIDEKMFNILKVGKPAPDFELRDTKGQLWRLSDFKGKQPVVLIWIFADWCGVCQTEFRHLTEMEKEYAEAGAAVATVECHDLYRSGVMVGGRELWWSHLVDSAFKVGAMYGVSPMEFVVHNEWINRPATIIIDKEGIVRLAYYGTYWGDRPTIEQTLEMVKSGSFEFEHPKRRK
ncbi:redoxin domain-containing protein [candidate division KSB1 bacterium]